MNRPFLAHDPSFSLLQDKDAPHWSGTLAQSSAIQLTLKGFDVYDVVSWEAQESVSQPYAIRAWVRYNAQESVPQNLVGQAAAFTFVAPDNTTQRIFHGLVSYVTDGGPLTDNYPLVKLEVRPTFWFLNLTEDCRIFSSMTALDIIKQVFNENNVIFDDKTTSAGKTKRDFCVQYQESHYAFVSRLMEEEGIFYYFTHASDRHTLVLMDDNKTCPKLETISCGNSISGGQLFEGLLYRLRRMQVPRATSIMLNDYNFQKPDDNLYVSTSQKSTVPLNLYTYPGRYTDRNQGEALSKQRLEAQECLMLMFEGLSSQLAFSAGSMVTVEGALESQFNAEYFLLQVSHHYGLDSAGKWHFSNTFKAIPGNVTFKPLQVTPKPRAYQDTALVTGRQGDEIYTNTEGDIKVKFHWDTRSSDKVKDEDRSCWIRVASGWAGSGWGMMNTPRVGQEVVITFLNHDPDRPLVVGSVYNGTHKPPYDQDSTQSGIRSHTTKEGTDENYNEIRLTDEKGKEEIFIQAEKDANVVVKDSVSTTIQTGSVTTMIERGDRSVTLKGDPEATNGKGDDSLTLEKGSRTVALKGQGGNLKTTVADGTNTLEITKGNDEITLTNGDRIIALKSGKQEVTITGGGYSLSITGGDVSIQTTGQFKVDATGGISLSTKGKMSLDCMDFSLSATTNADVSANVQLNMKGGAQASLKGPTVNVSGDAMTQIKGGMVMVN